jgi:hypothetical protein
MALAPLMAHLSLAHPTAERFNPDTRLHCGVRGCDALPGWVHDASPEHGGRGPWVLTISSHYAETSRGSGIWKLCRVRRPRSSPLPTGSVTGRRDRAGRLLMAGWGVGSELPRRVHEGRLHDPLGRVVPVD